MSKIEERALTLREALDQVADDEPATGTVASCKGRMVDAVVRAVGRAGAETAEIHADLVDIAVVREVALAGHPMSPSVLALISEFQADCIEIVVAAYRRMARISVVVRSRPSSVEARDR